MVAERGIPGGVYEAAQGGGAQHEVQELSLGVPELVAQSQDILGHGGGRAGGGGHVLVARVAPS